jgi:hypothetical protein
MPNLIVVKSYSPGNKQTRRNVVVSNGGLRLNPLATCLPQRRLVAIPTWSGSRPAYAVFPLYAPAVEVICN